MPKTVELLKYVAPPKNMVHLLREIADKTKTEFCIVESPQSCYFAIEGKSESLAVSKKKDTIVRHLKLNELGDEQGVFSGDDWYAGQLVAEGMSVGDVKILIECRKMEAASLTAEGDQAIWFKHRDQPFIEIMASQRAGNVWFELHCETQEQQFMLLRYLCSAAMAHFPGSRFTVDLWMQPYEWYEQ